MQKIHFTGLIRGQKITTLKIMSDKMKKPSLYSLSKSRSILKSVYAFYKRHRDSLKDSEITTLEETMSILDGALLEKNKLEASQKAKELEVFSQIHFKKSFFDYSKELIIALLVALFIATLVRQMWFEPYEIPTGSMRPTFREQDHLTVTKTAFGINTPLMTTHLYFDPDLVERSGILIFSGDGIPLLDSDTKYFGLFPYKKRYIKRCIGKPGDAIYFYGGLLYGVDRDGKEITEFKSSPWMQSLEYIPFLSFSGQMSLMNTHTVLIRQMLLPCGKLEFNGTEEIKGLIFNGHTWIKDSPLGQKEKHDTIETYSDIFGIRNYAEARLLTLEELKQFNLYDETLEEGELYLQLHHTPSLTYPKAILEKGNIHITGYTAIIPLQKKHLNELMNNLYTARFVVEEEKGYRYSLEEKIKKLTTPSFLGVADGIYEFYFGKAYSVQFGGILKRVPEDNPLYSHDKQNIQKMFNRGIEIETNEEPSLKNLFNFPHRYAYFRSGDLYLMGAPILKKEDPTLQAFNLKEKEKETKGTEKKPYVAFKDYGAPTKDGVIDRDFIRTFGVTVPEKHYLVLGDNHAMSFDSRGFGFVPENNIQGAPSWIIWPIGDRLGTPPQKPYPFLNFPRGVVWSIIASLACIGFIIQRRSLRRPIFKKIDKTTL